MIITPFEILIKIAQRGSKYQTNPMINNLDYKFFSPTNCAYYSQSLSLSLSLSLPLPPLLLVRLSPAMNPPPAKKTTLKW